MDFTLLMYVLTSFMSFLGFITFFWWWMKARQASIVYASITLLLASETFINGLQALGRHSWLTDRWDFLYNLYRSDLWGGKLVFHLAILTCIVYLALTRLYETKKRLAMLRTNKKEFQTDNRFKEEVLVVDDNVAVTTVFVESLMATFPNLHVHVAHDAEYALKIFNNSKKINLIIADLLLPGMNGFDLCKIIKYKCPWTVIIATTNYPLPYEFFQARKIGFEDYLQKPFSLNVMIGIIRRELHRIVAWKDIQVTESKKGE